MFSYVLSLVLLKAFFILFGIVVVIKRSEPFVKFGIKLIYICVVRIVEFTLVISYMVDATVALIRVSSAAVFSAIPPQPQMPRIPIRSGSTFS